MKHLGTTGRRFSCIAMSMLVILSACSSANTQSNTATDSTDVPVDVELPRESEITDVTSTDSEITDVTTVSLSVLDVSPEFEIYGQWWLVPNSTLVARGTLVGVEGEFSKGSDQVEIWSLEVQNVVLGEFAGKELRIARTAPKDADIDIAWAKGQEGIFFLVPLRLSVDTWSPELWVAKFGSLGVLTSDLDRWQAALPSASGALGEMWRSGIDQSDVARTLYTEVVVEGTVQSFSDVVTIFGQEFVDVELSGVERLWSPPISDEVIAEAGLDPSLTADDVGQIRLTSEQAALVPIGSTAVFFLGFGSFQGQLPAALIPYGGLAGIETERSEADDRIARLDGALADRDPWIIGRQTSARSLIQPVFDEFGRIPLPEQYEPSDAGTSFDEERALFNSPLRISFEGGVVEFSKWFFVLLDGTATVTVYDPEGQIVLQGSAEGEESVMSENAAGDFIFTKDGAIVAQLTSEEFALGVGEAYEVLYK